MGGSWKQIPPREVHLALFRKPEPPRRGLPEAPVELSTWAQNGSAPKRRRVPATTPCSPGSSRQARALSSYGAQGHGRDPSRCGVHLPQCMGAAKFTRERGRCVLFDPEVQASRVLGAGGWLRPPARPCTLPGEATSTPPSTPPKCLVEYSNPLLNPGKRNK